MILAVIWNTILVTQCIYLRRVVLQVAASLGFAPGNVVQEFYYDDDVDHELREELEQETGEELADVDYGDVVDGVLIWWRADDADEEDLADVLVDAVTNLDDAKGIIWVLTPKTGREGAISAADIDEAAKTCGLQSTSSASVGSDWSGMRLVSRGRIR